MRDLPRKLRKLSHCLTNPLYRKAILSHRVAAAIEHEQMLSTIQCATVIDIGANRGQFALAALNRFPAANIFSFEPLNEPAAIFESIFHANAQVQLCRCAIGERSEKLEINISKKDDSSSLLPISAKQSELFPGTDKARATFIQVEPLSHVLQLKRISGGATLLKLDVQGYELITLRGCLDLLSAIDYVYVECSFIELYSGQALAGEVFKWLQTQGYGFTALYNLATDQVGHPVQADCLFTKE